MERRSDAVTPHRMAVGALIDQFFQLRDNDSNIVLPRRHIRDFCLLLCNLMKGPDLPLKDLQILLSSGRYTMYNQLILKFNEKLGEIDSLGAEGLLDIISALQKWLLRKNDDSTVEPNETASPVVAKTSIVGCYLRRLVLNFDNLSFSEVTTLFVSFQKYYAGRRGEESVYIVFDKGESDDEAGNVNKKREEQDWPRRQAELFIAHQALLLSGNVEKAFSSQRLHRHLKVMLKSNPELAEAHFLSYMNALRVKDFCLAINSLYNCFDPTQCLNGTIEEKTKTFRYAALNLGVLHYHFGRREEALAALREAVMLAQEANDSVCLQHALSWMYCLTTGNKEKLLEHSILKSVDLNLSYLVSLGIQSFVQFAGLNGGTPKYIFETITRSDMVNCQNTYGDLTSSSYAQKAAMWSFYGKPEMSSLWSQLLLHLNHENSLTRKACFGEAACQAMCNIAMHLLLQGEYAKSHFVLCEARNRFVSAPVSHIWMLCENICTFVRCYHHGEWQEAEAAAHKMATYDLWESRLRLVELYIQKRDFAFALKCLNDILANKKLYNAKMRVDYHVRAVILLGEIQYASSYPNMVPPITLVSCIAYIDDFHIDYLGALAYLHLSNVQLLMGIPAQALKTMDRCLQHILTHGGPYDRARALLLYVKSSVANSASAEFEDRRLTLSKAIGMLLKIKNDFVKVEAHSRVAEVLYIQSMLCNELNLTEERNKCALDLRLLLEEHPKLSDTAINMTLL